MRKWKLHLWTECLWLSKEVAVPVFCRLTYSTTLQSKFSTDEKETDPVKGFSKFCRPERRNSPKACFFVADKSFSYAKTKCFGIFQNLSFLCKILHLLAYIHAVSTTESPATGHCSLSKMFPSSFSTFGALILSCSLSPNISPSHGHLLWASWPPSLWEPQERLSYNWSLIFVVIGLYWRV